MELSKPRRNAGLLSWLGTVLAGGDGVGSPFPANPRGPRRKRGPVDLAIVVPKLDPQWEFAALTALMKPPRKANLVAHKHPNQAWSEEIADRAEAGAREAAGRLKIPIEVTRVPLDVAGDVLMVVRLASREKAIFIAVAGVMSRTLPEVWFKVDRLWIHQGRWMRRVLGTKLQLGPAADVHVPRGLRAQLKGLL